VVWLPDSQFTDSSIEPPIARWEESQYSSTLKHHNTLLKNKHDQTQKRNGIEQSIKTAANHMRSRKVSTQTLNSQKQPPNAQTVNAIA
jgi:hypothetical protein